MNLTQLHDLLQAARTEIGKVIIGQTRPLDLALITILTRSHALLEGVPGVAKTLMVRTLGTVLGVPSQRIQFTPDLMPADILGTNVYDLHKAGFNLIRGPVFTSFLLADEINRAPAKTQSALLQAMQERKVSLDRDTHDLPEDFTVFATQNPIEYEGTYPLPEAQKDRFLLKIPMKCPERDDELALAQRMLGRESPEQVLASGTLQAVLPTGQLGEARTALEGIDVRDELVSYIVDVVRQTRSSPQILVGAGPRATQALLLSARALAVLGGRDFVIPEDVQDLAVPVLGHRIVLRPEFEIEGTTVDEVVHRILHDVAVPR